MPKVSVMMPVRNNTAYVGLAIKSVLAEPFKDFELLILDNESNDGTGEVVARAIEGVKNARCVRAERRHGDANARNALIAMSDADYILAADSDDVHIPGTLRSRVERMDENRDFAALYGKLTTIDPSGKFKNEILGAPYSRFALAITQPGILLRRKDILDAGGYLETGGGVNSYASDTFLWHRIAFKKDLLFFDEFVSYYRIHPTQQTSGGTTANFKADTLKWINDEVLKIRPGLTETLRKDPSAKVAKADAKAATIILGVIFKTLPADDLETRLKICENAAELSPDDYAPLFHSLPILFHRKDFQKALDCCEKLLIRFPKSSFVRMKTLEFMRNLFTAAKIPFDANGLGREIKNASSMISRISTPYFPKNGSMLINEDLFSQN